MTVEPLDVEAGITADYTRLDEIDKALADATRLLDQAEEAWLEVYDTTAEALKTEMEEQGRKGDPAEHWIVTQARRENRVAYTNWRRAKRAVEMLEKQLKAKTASMSGRQSQLKGLRAESSWTAPAPRRVA